MSEAAGQLETVEAGKWCLYLKEAQLLGTSPRPMPVNHVRLIFQIFRERSGIFKCEILQFLNVGKLKTLCGPHFPFVTFV